MDMNALVTFYASSVGVGFLLGFLPVLVGLGLQAVIKIYKLI